MTGIIILIIVLGVVGLIVNGVSYLMCDSVSFLRMLIIWGGIKKKYDTVSKERGLVVKPHDPTYDWGKTEFGDFKIELDLIDKPNRQSYRYKLLLDKNGTLIDGNHRDNHKFLIKLGLKDETPKSNRGVGSLRPRPMPRY